MLENDEQIVLDAANNVFVGPNGYFKIVIDKFDGKTVQAWHLEDAEGNSSGNLVRRSGGKHIDLLVNKNCRTVAHFLKRIALDVIAEQQARLRKLEN
jgi:hypothetical protein